MIFTSLSPTFLNLYTKVLGASSSVIGSATICFVSNANDAESTHRRGLDTASTFSRDMILIWAETDKAVRAQTAIIMIPLDFILEPSVSVCRVADCDYESVSTGAGNSCLCLTFLKTLDDHLAVNDLCCRNRLICHCHGKRSSIQIH